MKCFVLILLLGLTSCTRHDKQLLSFKPVKTASSDLTALAGPLYQKFKDSLDINHVNSVTGLQNVKIYMAKFRSDPNRIYAVNSKGSEILYVGMMRDDLNGEMAVYKSGEAVLISVKNGIGIISNLDSKQWGYFFTKKQHGGETGEFCQREPGETFSQCYNAEKDEFCDSFISCLAADTQPIVIITIAAACSCTIDGPL